MSLSGIDIIYKNKCWVCVINNFSDEIKTIIRNNLQEICHGAKQVSDFKVKYTYKNTLVNFFERYSRKTYDQKKGMLGELLAHVLLAESMPNLLRASVFFNTEERSVKKGFVMHPFSQGIFKLERAPGFCAH